MNKIKPILVKSIEHETTRNIPPYALKEFKNRWYLLANDIEKDIPKIFALDRITEIRKTTKRFSTPKEFDIKSYFLHSFGIGIKDKAEKVVLSFDRKKSGIYIEHLPLHDSQKILIDDENEIRVELYIFLTYDFLQELLSFGQTLTVIEPQILIDKVKEHYQNSLNKYNQ